MVETAEIVRPRSGAERTGAPTIIQTKLIIAAPPAEWKDLARQFEARAPPVSNLREVLQGAGRPKGIETPCLLEKRRA
ncbi:hypothetical protein P2H44_16225 [Albimonas sp. CAU 1670]|uniref:hypothetical protein n=1 Tax=Albimonas sp. CAU 1670 TaxID=3032599 RepID=UPI0023DBFE2E|nr:hypothetical protein [Albimonas sp. CAU 1670]MDF2234109.1 hypothetical protein [Albimonas sp. CAU 1670]